MLEEGNDDDDEDDDEDDDDVDDDLEFEMPSWLGSQTLMRKAEENLSPREGKGLGQYSWKALGFKI